GSSGRGSSSWTSSQVNVPLPGWTTAALASGTVRPFLIPPRDQGGRAHSLSGVRVQAEGTPGKVIQGRDVAAAPSNAQRPIDALGAPATVAAGTCPNDSVRNNPLREGAAHRCRATD